MKTKATRHLRMLLDLYESGYEAPLQYTDPTHRLSARRLVRLGLVDENPIGLEFRLSEKGEELLEKVFREIT